jgi:uncharacterized protein YueI
VLNIKILEIWKRASTIMHVKKNDGSQFIIVSCNKKKSPFDNIKGMNMPVSNEEIVNIVKEAKAIERE